MSNGFERQKHNEAGESGYYHFYGVVENRNDESNFGRVKVRIFGNHTENLAELPTDELTWAQIVLPVTASPNTMHNLWDGTFVTGFYADGIEKQIPIITGILATNGEETLDPEGKKETGFQDQREKKDCNPGESDKWAATGINTSPAASAANWAKSYIKKILDKTIHKSNKGYSEPAVNFNSKYPFNISKQYESGHLVEYDNTPGNERIAVTHVTGSRVHFLADGTIIIKSTKDAHIVSNGNMYQSTNGNLNQTIDGTTTLKSGTVKFEIDGSFDVSASGSINMNASGGINMSSGGNVNINGSTINLN